MSINRLNRMIESGNTYVYRGQVCKITGYSTIHDEITVDVDIEGIEQIFVKESESKLDLFLDCFKEITVPATTDQRNAQPGTKTQEVKLPIIYTESKTMFKKLNDILLEDIEKVRTKPEYVGQAKQVCNNISAIVNITKLQLQLLQEG